MIEDYEIENDDLDFQEQLEANRYAELIGLLRKYLPELKKDDGIAALLQNNNSAISEFLNQIRNLKIEVPPIPTPKVTVNNKEVSVSIDKMAQSILENQIELKDLFQQLIDKKTNYKMEVTEWSGGRIKTVIIKAI